MKSLNRILPLMTLSGLALLFSACTASQSPGGSFSQMVGSQSQQADLSSAPPPTQGGTASPVPTGGEPTPADPPPQTLGSYPWLMIIKYQISADRKTVQVRALALEENDPPGLPVFSGYLINTEYPETSNLRIPIVIEDRLAGLISFTIPYSWFTSNKTDGIMTGPFYTNAEFPLCRL